MDRTPPDWAIRTEADRRALAAGCYWDDAQAERVVAFIRRYVSPKYTSGEFSLFDWQEKWCRGLYGWRRPDGGRRFRRADLHIPKKNGKTLLVGCLGTYELVGAGVDSPLVVSFSTTKRNATQVFNQMKAAVNKSPKLRDACRVMKGRKTIEFPARDGEYWALSSDPGNAEGENMSCSVVDECHAHRSPKLYDALEHSMIGRADGVQVLISTAGNDLTHWYYGIVQKARNVVSGLDDDPQFYAHVYEADPAKDDLDDPAVWKRANPSLDLYPGFTTEAFRRDMASARKDAVRWLVFLRYRLNVFCRPEDGIWIDLEKWDRCRGAVPENELKKCPCWLGFDASATTDPTSLTAVWLLPDGRFFARSWAWVAEDGVRHREAQNLPRYQQFAAAGAMTITRGNMIDKEPVRRHIHGLRAAGHRVQAIVMDITGAHVFGNELAGDGFNVVRLTQGYREYNEPTTLMVGAVADGKLVHDGNEWLRWCVNSVRLDTDRDNRVRPVRARSADHIDGAVSMLMAFKLAHAAPPVAARRASVYDRRGVEFL